MTVLSLCFCARAFSSCGKWGPVFIAVRGPLTIAASLVAEHRLQTRRLSNCGSWAQLLRGMWDLPRPGLEPVSPALAGRFSTTAPPGKPNDILHSDTAALACRLFIKSFWVFLWKLILYACVIQDLFDCKWQNSSWFKKKVNVLEGYRFILFDLNSGRGDMWLDLRENRIWTFKCPQNSCSLQLSAVFLSACWFCPQPL